MAIDPSLITDTMARWQAPAAVQFDPLAQFAKIQALKSGIQEQQLGALKLQEAQQAFQDQQTMNDIYKSAYAPDPTTGQLKLNEDALYSNMAARGLGAKIPATQKAIMDSNKSAADLKKAQADANEAAQNYLGEQVLDIKDSGYDPTTFTAKIAAAVEHGALPAPAAATMIQQFQQNPTSAGVKALIDPLLTAPKVQDILGKRATAKKDIAQAGSADVTAQKGQAELPGIQADTARKLAQQDATALEAAFTRGGPDAFKAAVAALPPERARVFDGVQNVQDIRARAMSAEQLTQADQAALNARNLEADRKVTQAQAAARLAVEQQNAGINAKKFAMDYGGDAVQGWAKQVEQNPDTANQVPPGLRTPVMQQFTTNTGLPFPKPLAGTAIDQERASRNALDAVAQIKDAIADPDIQKRLGAILGRLGNAEQTVGTAVGLTPAQEAKAQQLRTNMRYLVFQEGKALLGGRMPQQLMESLEQSSPSVKMDAGTMSGALAGVTDAANRNLDQTYKQRFGENAARPRAAAGGGGGHVIEIGGKHYRYKGTGDTADLKNYTEIPR